MRMKGKNTFIFMKGKKDLNEKMTLRQDSI